MNTFYLSSTAQQTLLMLCLFCSMIVTLFYIIVSYERAQSKRNICLNAVMFMVLFALLSVLGDAFRKIEQQQPYTAILPFPMWLLWCVVGISIILPVFETVALYRQKGKNLSRRSVKQAIDTQFVIFLLQGLSSCAICKCTGCSEVWRKAICKRSANYRRLSMTVIRKAVSLSSRTSGKLIFSLMDRCGGIFRHM